MRPLIEKQPQRGDFRGQPRFAARLMCSAALLLAATLSVSAQPVVTGVSVDNISHSSARIHWFSSPASHRQVVFDTLEWWSANHTYRFRTSSRSDYQTDQFSNITGLEPATAYVACPLACTATGSCVSCGEADPQVEFTTSADLSLHPALPALPDLAGFEAAYPQNVTATLNVAGDCSNLQAQLNAAAGTTYADQTVEVVIPPGTICQPAPDQAYTLLPKSGSGWVVVRSGGLANLPPEGVRLTPAYEPLMATILNSRINGSVLDFQTHTAHHWRFVGIKFGMVPAAQPNDVKTRLLDTLVAAQYVVNHDLIFDRCYFHGPGYPDRIKYAYVGGHGQYNIGFLESYFDNIDIWRAYQSGITVSRPNASTNVYTGGMAYLGNVAIPLSGFTISLSGSGSGRFQIYLDRNGSVFVKHDVAADLTVNCTGCTAVYDSTLTVPSDAFRLLSTDNGNTTITGARFLTAGGAATGSPWTIQDATDVGVWEGSVGIYMDNVHRVIVRNNHIGVTGIGFFIEEYSNVVHSEGDIASDIAIVRNTFQSNNELFAPTAGATNRVGYRRQHVELKQGNRVLIEGNRFLDAWVGVNGVRSPAIYVANRGNGISQWAGTSDYTIRNNLVLNHPSCFEVIGMAPTERHSKLTSRVLIENNVCQANSWTRSSWWIAATPWDGGMVGMQLHLAVGGEDYTVRHNTFYDVRGYQPWFLQLTDSWSEGLLVRDNIFFFHNDTNAGGLRMYQDTEGQNARPAFSTTTGTAALNQGVRRMGNQYPGSPSWIFDHNVIVAGCNNSSTCTPFTSTNLVDIGVQSPLYPAGNYWPTGTSFGDRVAAVGFKQPLESNLYLLDENSPYGRRGSFASSDNRGIGAQRDELESGLGTVKDPTVTDVGQNAALLQYTAPDGAACTVEFGESTSWGTGTRISDGGGVRQRQVVLSGLTPNTMYSYRVLCAVQQPSGEFATASGPTPPTTYPIRPRPPSGGPIARALIEYGPSRALGFATDSAECADGCTITIPATSGQAIYHRVVYLDSADTMVRSGSITASIAH